MKRWLSVLLALVMLITAASVPGGRTAAAEDGTAAETAEEERTEAPAVQEEPEEKPAKQEAAPEKLESQAEEPAPGKAGASAEKPEEKQDPAAAQQESQASEAKENPGAAEVPENEPEQQAPQEEPEEAGAADSVPQGEEEKPAETNAAENAEQPEEDADAPAESDGNPPEDAPAEEQPEEADFRPGYALAKKGVKLYTNKNRRTLFGVLEEDAVVYAAERDEQTGSLSLTLAVEGEAAEAWAEETDLAFLTEEEAGGQESAAADLILPNGVRLVNASVRFEEESEVSGGAPEEDSGSGPAAPEEPAPEEEQDDEEEDAEDGEPALPSSLKEDMADAELPEQAQNPEEETPETEGTEPALEKAEVAAPSYLWVYNSGTDYLYMIWPKTSGLIYEIQRKQDGGSWTAVSTGDGYASDSSYFYWYDYTAVYGKAYQYRIRAWDGAMLNHSAWVKDELFFTDNISAYATVAEKSGYPTVHWDKAKGAAGYYIYRIATNRATGNTTALKYIATVTGNKTFSYKDTSVTVNRDYEYRVYPFRKAGTKTILAFYYAQTTATVRPIDGAPGGLSCEQVKDGVKLSWYAVYGATGYMVYYSENPYAETPTWKKAGSTTGTEYTVKDGITPGTSGKYRQYKVYATAKINGTAKKGPWAATDIIYRLGSTKITLQKGTDEDTIVVSWTKVRGADRYNIYYRLEGESSYRYGYVDGSYTSCKLTGANNNVTGTRKHQIYVRPVKTAGNNKTGVTQTGSRSPIKSIKPSWTYVVIAGNYDYPGSGDDLPGIKFDVAGMKKVFSMRGAKRITVGKNLTVDGFRSLVSSGFSGAGRNSICVLVYAGHGYDGNGGPAFVSGGMSSAQLKSFLDANVASQHVVLIHQACSSGGLIGKGAETEEDVQAAEAAMVNAFIEPFRTESKNGEFDGTKYTVIAAAECWTSSWTVWEWRNTPSNIFNGFSPMLRFLAASGGYDYYTKASTGRPGDKDKSGRVSVREAYSYARPKVRNLVWYGSTKYRSTMAGYFPEPDLPLF